MVPTGQVVVIHWISLKPMVSSGSYCIYHGIPWDIFVREQLNTISDLLKVEWVHSRWFGDIFFCLVPGGAQR